jgi:hypothetical protein
MNEGSLGHDWMDSCMALNLFPLILFPYLQYFSGWVANGSAIEFFNVIILGILFSMRIAVSAQDAPMLFANSTQLLNSFPKDP